MNHTSKITCFSVLALVILGIFTSCTSIPKEIPLELSAKELNQKVYYQTLIQRYGMDISVLIPAEFELAHVYIKQKKYDKAKPLLEKVLSYYEVGATNLPREYKKLAQIDLAKIPQEDATSQNEDN